MLTDIFAEIGRNKYSVAPAVAQRCPELTSTLPRKRKLWEGEDYRMSIFDAAAAGTAVPPTSGSEKWKRGGPTVAA